MIDGLAITPDFVTADEEDALVAAATLGRWRTRADKREQYFLARGHAPQVAPRDEIPDCMQWLAARTGFGDPYRLIISDYAPGQGMALHFDTVQTFPIVGAIVSLLGASEWVFKRPHGGEEHVVDVPPRSLLVFRGPARYEWKHAVRGITSRRLSYYFSFEDKQ